ncbi:MAG: biotin--[acetyl-CoA-carboxylase] ligase [Flavobacteriales bacterium]|nr:biotin--[acetyl-CoA-carboxylase] ligase [Flavobacteriales bacterium]
MYKRLFIGNKIISLIKIDSTNAYLKKLVASSGVEIEGLLITTKNQIKGRGQKGNTWESEPGKNLTFSVYLKPNLLIQNQFIISKVISLGIIDFLTNLGLKKLKIKWPNDIYCERSKISGILIENALKGNKIYSSVVGVGLNVNQFSFNSKNNPTSIIKEIGNEQDLDELLNQLLFFIEKRYLALKTGKEKNINNDYLKFLYGINEVLNFKVDNEILSGEISGINPIGKLRVKINNQIKEFDLKEIEFLI